MTMVRQYNKIKSTCAFCTSGLGMDMEQATWKSGSADALLAEFFAHDDLKALAADAGALLECPLLVLDDTFHVTAHHRPLGFTDPFF